MRVRNWLWCMVVALCCSGCGTTVVEMAAPVTRQSEAGHMKKVLVLPFADYTAADSLYDFWNRNVLVNEAICDELVRFGFGLTVYEDVVGYLLERGYIRDISPERPRSVDDKALELELQKDWSPGMKAELLKALYANMAKRRGAEEVGHRYWEDAKHPHLDSSAIVDIGRRFHADYVLRGRIIVFQTGREDTFNPLQTGLLPFVFKVGARTVFGVAESDAYEMIDKMAIAGVLGAAVADDNWPLQDDDVKLSGHPRFGGQVRSLEDYANWNTAIWGAAGAGLAFLAHKGGRVDSAWIQIRMIAQNTRTTEIEWSNRAEVKVTPKTFFGEKDPDILASEAIRHAVGRLMDNFVASLTGRQVVRSRYDGTFYVTAAGGTQAVEKTRYGTIEVGPPLQGAARDALN